MKTEFIVEQYRSELERRNQTTEALALPIGVLSGLVGLLGVMTTSFKWDTSYVTNIFASFIVLSCAFFLGAVYLLARCFLGNVHMLLPHAGILKKYHDQLAEHFEVAEALTKEKARERADSAFEDYFRERLVEAAEFNAARNDYRSQSLHKANGFILGMLVCTLVSGGPFVVQWQKARQQQANPNSAAVQEERHQMSGTPKFPPPPPPPPPNRIIREAPRPTPPPPPKPPRSG